MHRAAASGPAHRGSNESSSGVWTAPGGACRSAARGAPAHTGDVAIAIGWQAAALRGPDHLAQTFHHLMVSVMQITAFRSEQFHRLPNALRSFA